jgi:cytochrome P450
VPQTMESEVLHSETYRLDPFPVWERLRHDEPLFHDEVDDVWALTRHDDVAAVFRDWETYSTKPYANVFGPVIGRTLVEMDGDEHTQLRQLVAGPFAGESLRSYRTMVEQVAADLADRATAGDTAELYADFASHLPVAVMARVLGLPTEDHEFFKTSAQRIMAGLECVEPALSRGIEAHAALGDYLQPMIEERRGCPHSDVISRIVGAEFDGQTLTNDEIKTFVSLLVNAGGDTTSHALMAVMWNLIREPGVLEAVTESPELMDAAFSESMRRDGPVVYEDRIATRDVEWYGQHIPAGARVRAFIASANNDESVFADPLTFDLERQDLVLGRESRGGTREPGKAGHLGFGLGRHFCIGWQLARMEIVSGCLAFLERVDRPRVVPGSDPKLVIHFLVRTLNRLELEYARKL